jgi:hypothetical protein
LCLFAQAGCDVSVQYGANQPEYDLIVAHKNRFLKVSVKGSQDSGWGLNQSHKTKDISYHEAADLWVDPFASGTVSRNKTSVKCGGPLFGALLESIIIILLWAILCLSSIKTVIPAWARKSAEEYLSIRWLLSRITLVSIPFLLASTTALAIGAEVKEYA